MMSYFWVAGLCMFVLGQNPQNKDGQASEVKGLPPRATPADYEAHAQAGAFTLAAEFKGHSVPTQEATYSSEDYVAVEAALFGPAEARIKLSPDDFSLRINGKKTLLSSQPYVLVFHSLKDPEWAPPESHEAKSKTSIGGGGGSSSDSTPAPVHMPIELQRAMQQRVQRAALPEGDRALPQAGLIFFQFRGKTQHIQSLELIYAGPVGKATLSLQP
jgi:hypothetical protein